MTTKQKDPVLVVLQLTGGNDYLNTVVPYTDSFYYDYRPSVRIAEDRVLRLDDEVGLHPSMGPIEQMYAQGDVAIVHGVGYQNSPRSHFRSMDIWHTCEPDTLGTEGWLGRVIRELDPNKENVVTAVSMGPTLFRALALPGVPVACVDDLNNYGLLTTITSEQRRDKLLERYKRPLRPRDRQRTRYGLPGAHGAGVPGRRRRSQRRAGAVLLQRRVRRQRHRP